ncbi:uncharacterized protein LOC135195417 [Macrobrachium nipponense]|uniref:uncharacterized protein LOC135195417 n=1 Tax=Macrobrachium nipponense TaxID=159736 RepID=UPI0030C83E30
MRAIFLLIGFIAASSAEGTQSDCQEVGFPVSMALADDGTFAAVLVLQPESLRWTLDLGVVSFDGSSNKTVAMVTFDARSEKPNLNLNCTNTDGNSCQSLTDLDSTIFKIQVNGTLLKVYQKSPEVFKVIGKFICTELGKEKISLIRTGEETRDFSDVQVCSVANGKKGIAVGTVTGVVALALLSVCLVMVSVKGMKRFCKGEAAKPLEKFKIRRRFVERHAQIPYRDMPVPEGGRYPAYRIQEGEVTFTDGSRRTESIRSPQDTNIQVLYKVRTIVAVPGGICSSVASGRRLCPPPGASSEQIYQNFPPARCQELPENLEPESPDHIYDHLNYHRPSP